MEIHDIKFIASKSSGEVSGILMLPVKPKCIYVFAHGAGAGMKYPFMTTISKLLADEKIATLRFNFPYTEKKQKRPDLAPILMETIRSAINIATNELPGIPIFAGGKSMGGRMTSMTASKAKIDEIKGIIFFGFPLHAHSKPSIERAEHLYNVNVPMLFLQGTKDKLANLDLLKPIINKIGQKATLHIVEDADHSFQVPRRIGISNEEILQELSQKVSLWIDSIL